METSEQVLCVLRFFLEINGYRLVVDDDELYTTVKKIANEKMNLSQITEWLKEHAYQIH